MVGVPRSKGCLACLRRRVKCDETQPECQSCKRRGQICPGYIRERKFYHQYGTASQSKPSESTSQTDSLEIASANRPPAKYPHELQRRAMMRQGSIDEVISPYLVAGVLSQRQRESFCAFVDDVFPGIFYGYQGLVDVNWFDIARNERETGRSLDWALRSIGTWQLGKANNDPRQIIASREMYGRALQHLIQAIKNPNLVCTDTTLAAAILVGIYEMINATEQKAWLTHSRGISHLFRLRGPKAHIFGIGRTLILSFRGFLVFEALSQGEACFLEDEEWRSTLPETLDDEKRRGKSYPLGVLIEHAFHEIARCPGFLVRSKAIVASTQTRPTDRERLIREIEISQDTLHGLESQMLAGIKTKQALREDCSQSSSFFGIIPDTRADTLAKFSHDGINSALALLQQLLVVLVSIRGRRKEESPWLTLGTANHDLQTVTDPNEMMILAQEQTRLHPTGPQSPGISKAWPDRIAMSMGLPSQ
ncbi:uncharacterized protein N7511_005135 [Penicillium nucicola]|uniref:uncharacterized protein n=1 Tax=Penicillium nucicola TaxID=1850975 RepID=UPI00254543B3|nr:uncharacterized protein N7511_005135 [Penicillium nucicola]KAJ5761753.1 hypothetical protein N7511_005135 [Penicillium nucicola]